MAEYHTINSVGAGTRSAQIDAGLRAHMNKVYGLMSVGMLMTGAAAWAIAGLSTTLDPNLATVQLGNGTLLTSLGQAIYLSPLKWVIMFAPLIMVFAFSAMINRLSYGAAQLFFYSFAVMMGVSISSIFLIYTGASIAQTFLITAIAFAGLSLYGYTTKKRSVGHGHLPDDGPDRADRCYDREHLPRLLGAGLCHLDHRRADLCGSYRL